jgi:hypothetical protein
MPCLREGFDTMKSKKYPNPGSEEAVKRGCTCAVWDNCRGKGIGGDGKQFGWWITVDCLLHGSKPKEVKK